MWLIHSGWHLHWNEWDWTNSSTRREADVIVLNTCVVRQSAEDKAYGRL